MIAFDNLTFDIMMISEVTVGNTADFISILL